MSISRRAGYWVGKHKILSAAIAVLIGIWILAPKSADPTAPVVVTRTPEQVAARTARVEQCKTSLPERKASYADNLAQGKFNEARSALQPCPGLLDDEPLRGILRDVDRLEARTTAGNLKATPRERLDAIALLKSRFPAEAEPFEKQRAAMQSQLDKTEAMEREKREAAAAAAEKKLKLADAARRRQEGVAIGMTKADALASSWGKPRKVNTTTTANGTREQWVYDGGYLYFTDGVLTAIQN